MEHAGNLTDGDHYRVGTVSASNKFTLTTTDGSAHTYGGGGGHAGDTFTKVHAISVKGQTASNTDWFSYYNSNYSYIKYRQ